MTKRPLLIIAVFLLFSQFIYSQDKGIGVGIILGEPTGLNFKHWIDDNNAISGALAYSFAGELNSFAFHIDYLYHIKQLIKSENEIPFYYGFGGRVRASNKDVPAFGVRGIAGLAYYLKDVPVDIFFEIAPVFELIPSTKLDIDVGVGARYYFN